MIGVVDYGCGNVGSVLNMFSKIGIWSEKISDSDKLSQYSALVLPGVGSFDTGVRKLKQSGFWNAINHSVKNEGTPILGICLGMQLFFEGSEEGTEKGFGWLPGTVKRFEESNDLSIPHMSWNSVSFHNPPYDQLEETSYYFVHAFHAPQDLDASLVLGSTAYGASFPSAVILDNITGFQFHPEKSLNAGMALLKNWELSLQH